MQRFHRTGLGLGLLAALAMIIGTITFAPSAEADVVKEPVSCLSSGGCLQPSYATMYFFMDAISSLSVIPKVCSKQCGDFRRGCKKVGGASQKCSDAGAKGIFDSLKRSCENSHYPEDRRSCTEQWSYGRAEYRYALREDVSLASRYCKDYFKICRDTCINPI